METAWSRDHGASMTSLNAAYDVEWRDQSLRVYVARWKEGYETKSVSIVVAATAEVAGRFVEEVSAFCNHPRKSVLRYSGGC